MRFKVDSGDHAAEYSEFELMMLITKHFTGKSRKDLDVLAHTFVKFLERNEALHLSNGFQLMQMGAMLGFHYAQLRKNHTVETIEENDEQEDKAQHVSQSTV